MRVEGSEAWTVSRMQHVARRLSMTKLATHQRPTAEVTRYGNFRVTDFSPVPVARAMGSAPSLNQTNRNRILSQFTIHDSTSNATPSNQPRLLNTTLNPPKYPKHQTKPHNHHQTTQNKQTTKMLLEEDPSTVNSALSPPPPNTQLTPLPSTANPPHNLKLQHNPRQSRPNPPLRMPLHPATSARPPPARSRDLTTETRARPVHAYRTAR